MYSRVHLFWDQEMEKIREKRRIVLVPAPGHGHITPLMRLGEALQLRGFSITVAQLTYNKLSSSLLYFPGFQFITIPETLPQTEFEKLSPLEFLLKFNKASEESFKDCISQLLIQQGNDIVCIVYDELMYFSEAAAKEFKLPSAIYIACNATNRVCFSVLSKLNAEKFSMDMKDPEVQEKVLEELHHVRYKDLPTSGFGSLDVLLKILKEVGNTRTASALIMNTVRCLESLELSWLEKELQIPVYPLGPLNGTASVPSSLMEEDMSCIEWLNKQKPNSVIYISLGSAALTETKEVLEMAWGLCDSNQPFLWVIRPGSIPGCDWIESLPEEVSKLVPEKGYIVKWAPQIKVLEHPAVGGFLSHCGWNSAIESISAGVPLICRPFAGEQKLNARCVESVWRIRIELEGEVEREEIMKAVKRLMSDEEGEGMRERALGLKEKLKAALRTGGSSSTALDELVKHLKTE